MIAQKKDSTGKFRKLYLVRNIPNILSVCRILGLAPLIAFILLNQPWTYTIATILFALIALTDILDGRLARHYQLVSRIGIFLDLIADKILVTGILIAMVEVHLVPAWIVIIIVMREFVVTGMRTVAASEGIIIPAGRWGKMKTLITLNAIGGIMLARALGAHLLTLFPLHLQITPQQVNVGEVVLLTSDGLMLLALIWTIFSALAYLRGASSIFRSEKTMKYS